jgi:hypothetical protein
MTVPRGLAGRPTPFPPKVERGQPLRGAPGGAGARTVDSARVPRPRAEDIALPPETNSPAAAFARGGLHRWPRSGPDRDLTLRRLEALRDSALARPGEPIDEAAQEELDVILFSAAAVLRQDDGSFLACAELLYRPCSGIILAQRLEALGRAMRGAEAPDARASGSG